MNASKTCLIFQRLTAILCLSLIAACAVTGPTVMYTKPNLEYDKYAAEWVLTGAKFNPKSIWSGVLTKTQTEVCMRGTFDESLRKKSIKLYVNSSGEGAGGLIATSASDSTGTQLKTHRLENTFVQHNVLGTYVHPKELIAIDLPRDYLDARKADGLDIRLNGYQQGSLTVAVTANYLTDFLDRFDSSVAEHKSKK